MLVGTTTLVGSFSAVMMSFIVQRQTMLQETHSLFVWDEKCSEEIDELVET